MRTCALCQADKRDTEFRKFGRGLRKVCLACENGVAQEGSTIADALPVVTITGKLEVQPGYGFRASIEDRRLILEQDGQDDGGGVRTDSISLAPHEARQLIEFVQQLVEEVAA